MARVTADRRRGERGMVLLLVAVMGLLAMAAWGLAWRSTHDAIRVEGFLVRRAKLAASVLPALAHGVARLRGGHPPTDPYECVETVIDGAESWDCRLLFTSQDDSETWEVTSRLATTEEVNDLPHLPLAFSD